MTATHVPVWARTVGAVATVVMFSSACGGVFGGEDSSAGDAACENYPSKDVELVVGRSPGGGHDEYGRFVARLLGQELGTNVVVKNVDGAGGRVAASQVLSAQPDGHQIHLMEPNGLAALQAIEDVDYDLKEFTYLGLVNDRPSTFAVSADSDIENFEDLVAEGKNSTLKFATAGLTSPNFVNGVIASEQAGIQFKPVPHDGSSEAITSVVRGDTDFTVFSGDSIAESVDAGDLRALAQFGSEPLDVLSDVPTAEDVGLGELGGVLTTNLVMVAPPELPDCLTDRLTDVTQKVLNSDEFAEFGEKGRIVTPGDPDEARQIVDDALATYEEHSDTFEEYLSG